MQPQIIGFGAQKAGTTWLFDNLSTNPGIWKPVLKEMHFFSHADTGATWMLDGHWKKIHSMHRIAKNRGQQDRVDHLKKLLNIKTLTEAWYLEAYRPCPIDKVSMDITPAYAMLSLDGLRYMNKILGSNFKVIYQIRDPAERVLSSLKGIISKDENGASLAETWIKGAQQKWVNIRSDYLNTITRLDDFFGDRVLYLPFREIKDDPLSLLRQVERHCGLPKGNYIDAGLPKHTSPRIDTPKAAASTIRDMLTDQYSFLEKRFSRSFLEKI